MPPGLQTLTAALYALAGLVAAAAFLLGRPRLGQLAVGVLAAGAVAHGIGFSLLHTVEPTPPLTHLPSALSFAAWVGTLGFLVLAWRNRLAGLVALVAPMSFLGVVASLLGRPQAEIGGPFGAGSLPHAHVLLASAGLALLGLAGLAGMLFLIEHRRLKRRRRPAGSAAWPSLEALDRAGAFAVASGFPLLTLGVLTGALWQRQASGALFSGAPHEIFSLLAWAVYAGMASMRFGARQPARRLALAAVAGFACLGFAVVGAELLA
jgi:ABC-type transport system involved in cytochrome c biogenesis permease subunit